MRRRSEPSCRRLALWPAALAVAAAGVAAPSPAVAREPVPQYHEVRINADATFTESNEIDLEGRYTYRPESLNRRDEVVPLLRPFVRAPIELWVRLGRQTTPVDAATGAFVGGRLPLLDGRLGVAGELGFEHVAVKNDVVTRTENAYLNARGEAEVTVRPIDILELGGRYVLRRVVLTMPEVTSNSTERSGQIQELGGVLRVATPTDRIYAWVQGGYRLLDYDFTGVFAGPLTMRAWVAEAMVSFQLDARTSIFVHGEARLEHWNNERQNYELIAIVPESLETDATTMQGEIGLLYWFEGRWGFRVSAGGGYGEAAPVFLDDTSPRIRLGVGFTNRF